MNCVLVTGARGFVGNILCPMLTEAGYRVRSAARTAGPLPSGASENVVIGDVGARTEWGEALQGVDRVIHLAARVHVQRDAGDAHHRYLETNARGTQRLATEALRHGIRRFIYLSSVKVNGEETRGRAYTAEDVPQPLDAYGFSKWQGERLLAQVAAGGGMQFATVRAPVVYGTGVRANFLRLLRWVDRERLLPLGAVRNQRSLVSVWSLCDLLIRLLEHAAAPNGTWMVSDDEDVSTPELVRRIARAMGRHARLVSVPTPLLRMAGALLGKRAEVSRLCGSLTVDLGSTRALLGWLPPLSMDEALARTVSWYRSQGCEPT